MILKHYWKRLHYLRGRESTNNGIFAFGGHFGHMFGISAGMIMKQVPDPSKVCFLHELMIFLNFRV